MNIFKDPRASSWNVLGRLDFERSYAEDVRQIQLAETQSKKSSIQKDFERILVQKEPTHDDVMDNVPSIGPTCLLVY